jgi:hypothetical protein
VSAYWDEESNIDESGHGWIQYARGTVSGLGTGTGTISLQMGMNGEGIYILRASGLNFDVTTTSWSYEKDPVSGIPFEHYFVSTGRREVFFPRVEGVLPRSGVLKGNKQVQLSGSGIANVSWTLLPLKTAGLCKLTGIRPHGSKSRTSAASTTVTLFKGVAQKFTAKGKGLAGIEWIAHGATPASGTGPTFTTMWPKYGKKKKTLTATCGGVTKTAQIIVLDVSIDINRRPKDRAPPSDKEDIVQVKSNHPPNRFTVPCRIKLKGPATSPQTVVLTDPTFRLRFPGPTDTTRTLVLPANGTFKAFEITGEQPSVAKDDAKIQARLNIATLVAEKDVTVFSFDQAKIQVKKGTKYVLDEFEYAPSGTAATFFVAKARLRPAGLDCGAPQIKNLRVGIMQEMFGSLVTSTWDTPTVKWKAGVSEGTTFSDWETVRKETRMDPDLSSGNPVLISLTKSHILWDITEDALKRPEGCAGAGAATSSHRPSTAINPAARPFRLYSHGRVRWNNHLKTTIQVAFRIFCVVYDTKTKLFCALRQAEWEVNVDSSLSADQYADVQDDDDVFSDPAKWRAPKTVSQIKDVGTAIVTFIK